MSSPAADVGGVSLTKTLHGSRFLATVNGAAGGRHAGLTLSFPSTEPLGFKLGPPLKKKPIRFSVGQPGLRSTTWRLWANKAKGDVYLASRRSAGIFKISLHESGDWRQQWIQTDPHPDARWSPAEQSSAEGRVMVQWRRPEQAPNGWTDALSIWVRAENVSEIPYDDEVGVDTQWVAAPPMGLVVEFRLYLVKPRRGPFDLTEALEPNSTLDFLDGFRLQTGEVVLLFAHTRHLCEPDRIGAEKARRKALDDLRGVDFDLASQRGPRTAVWVFDDDGHANLWDISLTQNLRHGSSKVFPKDFSCLR